MTLLVKRDLMTAPQPFIGGESYNWYLTELGVEVALSVLPIKSNEIKRTLDLREQLQEWVNMTDLDTSFGTFYEMRMFKINPKLIDFVKSKKVLIRTGQWGAYWRANASGYTHNKSSAGVYDFKDAFERTSHCGKEKQISFQIN